MAYADYHLAPNEELIFELNIDSPSRSDNAVSAALSNLIKLFLPCTAKAPAILVVTNLRVIITNKAVCCGNNKEKYMWSFPKKSLNGNNAFSLKKGSCSCCDIFTISIGLSLREDSNITFQTKDISSVEHAEALLAKLHELYMS